MFFVRQTGAEAMKIRDVCLKKWAAVGVNIKNFNAPVSIVNPSSAANVRIGLMNAFKEATTKMKSRCQLIVCIIDKTPQIYETIKRTALCEAGIATQCMLSKNLESAEAIKDQYITNVALKVNIKIGGATNTVSALPLSDKRTMYMGADVTHPAPGSGAPSIAAIVATTDKEATLYNTYIRSQNTRVEIIGDLKSVMDSALNDYRKANQGQYPARIVFFRDGVAVFRLLT